MVPGLLDQQWCERLRSAIKRYQANPNQFYGVLSPRGEPKVDSDPFRWFDDPDVAEATHSSALPALGAALCGAEAAVLIEDQWFCSEPGAGSRSARQSQHRAGSRPRPLGACGARAILSRSEPGDHDGVKPPSPAVRGVAARVASPPQSQTRPNGRLTPVAGPVRAGTQPEQRPRPAPTSDRPGRTQRSASGRSGCCRRLRPAPTSGCLGRTQR